MSLSTIQRQNHLFWRAGFGPTPEMLYQRSDFKPVTYFDALWTASSNKPAPILVARNMTEGLMNGLGELGRVKQLSEEQRKEMRQQLAKESRQQIRNLNLLWLDEMVQTPAQLREKMAFFWHGHFACRNLNSYFQQDLLQVIRENALGNFGDLLREVSKTPAMLAFLNNQQNRKEKPNENFAREVMELFTLGRGHYIERDIKEAARAFTGWGFNASGEFVFRRFAHDDGSKTILGHTGHFDGDDVIDILLANKQTAVFICTKLYRFLVNDKVNDKHVDWLANRFFANKYELKPLLKDLFTADWFYSPENVGCLIKSPVELWVGIRRIITMELNQPEIQLLLQRALGQVLFYPPNVAGWPGGYNWIDSSTLMLRLQLAQLVATAEGYEIKLKQDDDVEMGAMRSMAGNRSFNRFKLQATLHHEVLTKQFDQFNPAEKWGKVKQALLQTGSSPSDKVVQKYDSSAGATSSIWRSILLLMSTPEYQLC